MPDVIFEFSVIWTFLMKRVASVWGIVVSSMMGCVICSLASVASLSHMTLSSGGKDKLLIVRVRS